MMSDINETIKQYFQRREYNNITELCHIMKKKDCDKGLGFHNYSTFYHKLLTPYRYKSFKFLEIGYDKNGVSIPAWREYFANAEIYGADRQVNASIDNIHYLNQTSPDDIHRLMKVIGNMDIILDDGIHTFTENFNLFSTMFEYLNDGGIYIIEDLKGETRDEFQKRKHEICSKFQNIDLYEIIDIPYVRNQFDNRILIITKLFILINI
jgi:hypothetical protein